MRGFANSGAHKARRTPMRLLKNWLHALTLSSLLLGAAAQAATVPAKGTAATLDIASWNIEWLGATGQGPTNETLQLSNARDVIAGTDFDLWGLAEIVSTSSFNSLKSQLPGYSGFLANDAQVIGGATYYSASEQKVGLLYKSSMVTLLEARIILTANDSDFAGRPPLQAKLRVNLNGRSEDVVVIVLHAKCCSDSSSWTRRYNASVALKNHIDAWFPTQKVWVIGDFNDDLDTSISAGLASPYANFSADSGNYRFVTRALTDAGISSTTSYPDTIDHHLVTNEAQATYVDGSVSAYRVDAYITDYANSTSDHYPVLSRYTWAAAQVASVLVTAPNGGESYTGGSTQQIRWTATNSQSVRIETSLDGSAWTLLASNVAAGAGSYSWTLPNVASTQARVRVSDAASGNGDTSDAPFSITPATTPGRVILNEVLANEPGSSTAGEFIEIVNVGGTAVDISGWTLADAGATRHSFASGTVLQPGKALVVYGGSSGIPSGLTNALAASSGGLNLANSGDTVRLRNAAATLIDSVTYASSLADTDGVSMNRSPDGSASGSWVKHTVVSTLSRSGGLKASGAGW